MKIPLPRVSGRIAGLVEVTATQPFVGAEPEVENEPVPSPRFEPKLYEKVEVTGAGRTARSQVWAYPAVAASSSRVTFSKAGIVVPSSAPRKSVNAAIAQRFGLITRKTRSLAVHAVPLLEQPK